MQLFVKNQQLDLNPGDAMNINIGCPIFDRNRINRTFSLPLKLPLTPRNQAALGYVNRQDRRDRSGIFPEAVLNLGGAFWTAGELLVTGNAPKYIEVVFRSAEIPWLEKLPEVKINEILETLEIPKIAFAEFEMGDLHVPNYWQFVINGTTYGPHNVSDYPPNSEATIAVLITDAINADHPGLIQLTLPPGGLPILKFYLSDYPAHKIDYVLSKGFFPNPNKSIASCRQENFSAYALDVLANPIPEVAFPVISWKNFYAGKNPFWNNWFNPASDGEIRDENFEASERAWATSWLPTVRHSYILERIRNLVGLGAVRGVPDYSEIGQLVVISNYSCDEALLEQYAGYVDLWKNGFVPRLNLNLYVPSVSILDYLVAFAELFSLYFELNGKDLWIKSCRDLIIVPPADWSDYIDPNSFTEKIPEVKGFSLDYPEAENDLAIADPDNQLEGHLTAPGLSKTTVKASIFQYGLGQEKWLDVSDVDIVVPVRDEKGVSSDEAKPSNSQIYWMFNKGEQSFNDINYEFATNNNELPDRTVDGQYSLQWNLTPFGLYRQWHRGIAELADRPIYTATAYLPVAELMKYRRWTNARVRFFTPTGDIICVLKNISAKFAVGDDSGIIPCQVEMVIQ
jgi:hypothetical protein